MTVKQLEEIMTRLTSENDHKKQIQLAKANAEITTIQREADAYWNGVYDALKEIKNAMLQPPKGE